ncbi:MAG TPA: hypothetical protein VM328_12305 [Fimbriimonadaceae bacterium]|nr:hypothetical protein [Fimbriimonadaceae bacterium]
MARQILDQVKIASPCPASWNDMEGDDRVRFCQLCRLSVHDISAMTASEAEAFLFGSSGRICARMRRRRDGRVITRDCPVGLWRARRRLAHAGVFAIVLLFGAFAAALARFRGVENHYDARERLRSLPLIGRLLDHFDPPVVVGAIPARP